MKKLKLSRVSVILILAVIILLHIGVRAIAGSQKEYFHMDEMYSYGLMNYNQVSIADADDLMGQWHSPDYFRDYISISSEEAGDWSSVYNNQVADVHPPLFYLLLRVFASFTIDGFSKWTGIILNIVIWIGSAILVFLISRRITRDDRLALAITFFVGLTPAMLNSAIYIRMYELVAFNILLITHLALQLLNRKKIKLNHAIILILALVTGVLTHYHYLFYTAVLAIMVIYKLYKSNRISDVVKFIASGVVAVGIALAVFPAMISHLLHGHPAADSALSSVPQRLVDYLSIINRNVLSNIGIVIAGILLVILIVNIIKKKKKKLSLSSNWHFLILPTAVYCLIIAATSPWIELRYVMPVCPIIAMTILIIFSDFIKNCSIKWYRVATYALIGTMIIATPIVHPKLEMAYQQYDNIVGRVADLRSPILYVFNTSHNRLLDDMYLLTLADSYIINSNDIGKSALDQVFATKDVSGGLIVIINSDNENDPILRQIESAADLPHTKWIQRLNAADVYHLTK